MKLNHYFVIDFGPFERGYFENYPSEKEIIQEIKECFPDCTYAGKPVDVKVIKKYFVSIEEQAS